MSTHDAHPERVAPIPTADWSPAAHEAMEVLPPEMRPGPGQFINSLGMFAHHPELGRQILEFSLYLRFRSTMTDRVRELLVLRTAWHRGARYELLRHARLARRFGFTDDEIIAVTDGPDAPSWSADEALLLRMADELCTDYRVSDSTWALLAARWTTPEIMDMLFTVGCYDMFAMGWNSLGLQPEDDLPAFPGGR